ncbi:MAG: DUF805 domain-containing protein [Anaerovibrio sp.]|nr:DUF805 domain-containing protein [Anaerovibrio sp.]
MSGYFSQCGPSPSLGDKIKFFFTIRGRLNRKRYNLFILANFLLSIAGSFMAEAAREGQGPDVLTNTDIVILAAALVMTVAGITMGIRRLHDLNRTGWWMLVELIPILGSLILSVYLMFFKGTDGYNEYGPDPLQEDI